MRTANATLQAFLLSKQPFYSADLYTIQLTNGQTIRMCTADRNIVANGYTYLATTPAVKRGTWSVKSTQEVPTLTFSIFSTGTDYRDSLGNIVNFKELAHQGALDYAYIQLDRAFMPTFGDVSLGTVLLFGGRTAGISINATGVAVTCKGDNVLMQQYMPKNMYQLGCIHMLYDAGCTLSKAANTITQNIGAGPLNQIFLPWSSVPVNVGYYQQGQVEIMSGAGTGQTRSIIGSSSEGIGLAYPLYTVPAPGDSMAVSRGCQKSQAACNTFGNIQHYRGFPFIPPVETAY